MSGSFIATLEVVGLDSKRRTLQLRDGESIRVGRIETADLHLDDPGVSRSHAMFSASASGVVVSDLSSTNGTYVNGSRIKIPFDLKPSDVVDIGPFKITVAPCSQDPKAELKSSGRTMTAQLKPINTVVLVARIRGYKAIREVLPADKITLFWKWWNEIVESSVKSSGGKIDKVLDDCIVAVWYAPVAQAVSSSAVKATQQIDLQTRQFSVSDAWPYHNEHPLTCSLVLNTGLALTGSVGGKDGLRDFVVLGDTVNIAFKLAEATEALAQSVFVNEELAHQLGSSVKKQQVGKLAPEKDREELNIFAIQL